MMAVTSELTDQMNQSVLPQRMQDLDRAKERKDTSILTIRDYTQLYKDDSEVKDFIDSIREQDPKINRIYREEKSRRTLASLQERQFAILRTRQDLADREKIIKSMDIYTEAAERADFAYGVIDGTQADPGFLTQFTETQMDLVTPEDAPLRVKLWNAVTEKVRQITGRDGDNDEGTQVVTICEGDDTRDCLWKEYNENSCSNKFCSEVVSDAFYLTAGKRFDSSDWKVLYDQYTEEIAKKHPELSIKELRKKTAENMAMTLASMQFQRESDAIFMITNPQERENKQKILDIKMKAAVAFITAILRNPILKDTASKIWEEALGEVTWPNNLFQDIFNPTPFHEQNNPDGGVFAYVGHHGMSCSQLSGIEPETSNVDDSRRTATPPQGEGPVPEAENRSGRLN